MKRPQALGDGYHKRPRRGRSGAVDEPELEPFPPPPAAPAGIHPAGIHPATRRVLLERPELMGLIFKARPAVGGPPVLAVDDVARAACAHPAWRALAGAPDFWSEIDLTGRAMPSAKVRALLLRHTEVRRLVLPGAQVEAADLVVALPALRALSALELGRPRWDRVEISSLAALTSLERLEISTPTAPAPQGNAGGAPAPAPGGAIPVPGFPGGLPPGHPAAAVMQQALQQHALAAAAGHPAAAPLHGPPAAWAPPPPPDIATICSLTSLSLKSLRLAGGAAARMRLVTPLLVELDLDRFLCQAVDLAVAPGLRRLAVHGGNATTDGHLRALLRVRGSGAARTAQPLPALRELEFTACPLLSSDLVAGVAGAHTALEELAIRSSRVLGTAMCPPGGFRRLRRLVLDTVDTIPGDKLAEAVAAMPALHTLEVSRCGLLFTAAIEHPELRVARFVGTRTLRELSLRCPRLERLALEPAAPGQPASLVLGSLAVASAALAALELAALPALAALELDCPALLRLDIAECPKLGGDALFAPLLPRRPGAPPACPRLRALCVTDCAAVAGARLAAPELRELRLAKLGALAAAELDCPALTLLQLDECGLRTLTLRSAAATALSLGACARLASATIDAPALVGLSLKGCHDLSSLSLRCPLLATADASFCHSLSGEALGALARCAGLEELTLSAAGVRDLGAIAPLARLCRLDLAHMPLDAPWPAVAELRALTALSLRQNYNLRAKGLEPAVAALRAATAAAAAAGAGGAARGRRRSSPPPPPPPPPLAELDVSYCDLPASMLAALATECGLARLVADGAGSADDKLWPLLHAAQPAVPRGRGAAAPAAPATLHALSLKCCKRMTRFFLGAAPAAQACALGAAAGAPLGAGLVVAATPLGGLVELSLGGAWLREVAVALPRLRALEIESSPALASLALAAPALERLSLARCTLPLAAIAAAVAALPALTMLDVQQCTAMAEPGAAQALRAACPTLRQIVETPPRRPTPSL